MKQRDLVKILEKAGYEKIREDGDHMIYWKKGRRIEQVPNHREINENTARGVIKRVAELK